METPSTLSWHNNKKHNNKQRRHNSRHHMLIVFVILLGGFLIGLVNILIAKYSRALNQNQNSDSNITVIELAGNVEDTDNKKSLSYIITAIYHDHPPVLY